MDPPVSSYGTFVFLYAWKTDSSYRSKQHDHFQRCYSPFSQPAEIIKTLTHRLPPELIPEGRKGFQKSLSHQFCTKANTSRQVKNFQIKLYLFDPDGVSV